jgi:hypothetical protein
MRIIVPFHMSTPKRPALFVGAGLGDVARRLYLTDTYDLLGTFTEPASILSFSHNPSALDFFRFHPNSQRLVLIDAGHIYMALLHDRNVERKDINRRVFEICGFTDTDFIARRREPKPIGFFHAPDVISDAKGHIVIHAFGRGWGNWPETVCEAVRSALRDMPVPVRAFVICATHISTDGRRMMESFPCDLPHVTVLQNLSAPAAFSLVASASRFIGTISSLAQVAAFEGIPSLVLHPERCSDFIPPFNDYSKTILHANGMAIPYGRLAEPAVGEAIRLFLRGCGQPLKVRELFTGIPAMPDCP